MNASIFNTFAYGDSGERLLYNSLRNSLVTIDDASYDVYQRITSATEDVNIDSTDPAISAIISDLKKGGFIVENDMNEIDYVRVVDLQSRFLQNKKVKLTIAVTADCNFNCTYCYEKYKNPQYMSRETEEKIIEYVSKHLESDGELSITWYGGEPLLAIDTIYRLSEAFIKLADEKKAKYSAYIITNGYLLNVKVAENLQKYNVTGAQITVDGPPEYHNRVRRLRNREGTFDRILGNIRNLKNAINDFNISIRMNIGKENCGCFSQLIDKLEEYGIKDKIVLNIMQLEPHEYLCPEVNAEAMTPEDYSKAYIKIASTVVDRGVAFYVIPNRSMSHCSSIKKEGFLIGPDGKLYKCWDVIGNLGESVGEIGRDVKIMEGSIKWLAWDMYKNVQCRSCSVLPLCMGGCPRKTLVKDHIANSIDKCSFMRYNFAEMVKIIYKQRSLVSKNANGGINL